MLGGDARITDVLLPPFVAAQLEPLVAIIRSDPILHVFRNVHHDRAGPAGARDIKRSVDGGLEVLRRHHQKRVLGAHAHDVEYGRFLKRIGADRRPRYLTADQNHRN